jgi:hypothetical protein
MSIAAGIAFIVLGAIFKFALKNGHIGSLNLGVVGVILILAGIVGILLPKLMRNWSRFTRPDVSSRQDATNDVTRTVVNHADGSQTVVDHADGAQTLVDHDDEAQTLVDQANGAQTFVDQSDGTQTLVEHFDTVPSAGNHNGSSGARWPRAGWRQR